MSKSDPESSIFMDDSEDDVARKIRHAYFPSPVELYRRGSSKQPPDLDSSNPCLDYLQYIIFSQPNATFTVFFQDSPVVFESFEAVREKILTGVITEEVLKTSLTHAINALLQPVRDYFRKNDRARFLLESVKQFCEKKPTAPSSPIMDIKLTCLVKATDTLIALVVAPFAQSDVTLADCVSLIRLLFEATTNYRVVLLMPDWGSFSLNALNGDIKAIRAYYKIFTRAVSTLCPNVLSRVEVILQSALILSSAGDYWTTAIHIGRKVPLQRLVAVNGEENMCAGFVVSALLFVCDVFQCRASAIFCYSALLERLATLATSFAEVHLKGVLLPPKVVHIPKTELPLRHLLEDSPSNSDNRISLFDSATDVHRKLKRSFCEPGNISFCPPLLLLEHVVLFLEKRFCVQRTLENGGDVLYTSAQQAWQDYEEYALHPGDLKPSIITSVNSILEPFRALIKENEFKKLVLCYKNCIKKIATH
ncbi:uncharacterized protein LOC135146297 [Zophobas morio]|uniref:uncharacterized protein LOC135146297 n=1 Tax=Zophobas morio TaxID=2755281 RepID=UPI0030832946